MFDGTAEEAIFSTYLYLTSPKSSNSHVTEQMKLVEKEQCYKLTFPLKGTHIMEIDSPILHNFTFTPAISLFVTCESVEEFDTVYEKLSQGGEVLMPIAAYPFSAKFC